MTNRGIATRYARALLEVAAAQADPPRVERDLELFAGLLQEHAALQQALTNPVVPAPRKRDIVQAVLRSADVQPVVAKLLLLMAERDRLRLLPELVEAYRVRLMDYMNVVRAEVTSAVPLPEDRVRALERQLAAATGKHVTIVPRVDASILGGVVTRLGSLVYDGSVRRHLERMQDELVQRA